EDMLARTFYSHETPEGIKAWDRVRAAGYEPDIVGENIAAGHIEVSEVMDAWMYSPGHRRNILDVRLRDIGIGVAVGSHDHRYQILWVQDFATLERAP
ncbi:MAG TPA: CAP domain-containing protein, partial [Thermoanaerobaculia bacterium]|nr:CAP domain-containing protein [Thermoanaerobaculia bacterium]